MQLSITIDRPLAKSYSLTKTINNGAILTVTFTPIDTYVSMVLSSDSTVRQAMNSSLSIDKAREHYTNLIKLGWTKS